MLGSIHQLAVCAIVFDDLTHFTWCRAVYARYQKDADPPINFFMVFLMLGLGSAVVIGIPRLMKKCAHLFLTRLQIVLYGDDWLLLRKCTDILTCAGNSKMVEHWHKSLKMRGSKDKDTLYKAFHDCSFERCMVV